jgi:hypothetical protein
VRTFLTVAPFALSRLLGAAANAPLHRTADAFHVGLQLVAPRWLRSSVDERRVYEKRDR